MPVKVLYNDLRTIPPEFRRIIVDWYPGLSACRALHDSIGPMDAQQIIDDLDRNDPEIMVSWLNEVTDPLC